MKARLVKCFIEICNASKGATAVEYGMIAALIAVVIIAGATAVGTGIENTFNNIANVMQTDTANTGQTK